MGFATLLPGSPSSDAAWRRLSPDTGAVGAGLCVSGPGTKGAGGLRTALLQRESRWP